MIAVYLERGAAAPLRDRPNHLIAEIEHVAARDRVSLFEAALAQLCRETVAERELPL